MTESEEKAPEVHPEAELSQEEESAPAAEAPAEEEMEGKVRFAKTTSQVAKEKMAKKKLLGTNEQYIRAGSTVELKVDGKVLPLPFVVSDVRGVKLELARTDIK